MHTSTYLGNPVGCAAALAVIEELAARELSSRANRIGEIVRRRCEGWPGRYGVAALRGRGAFWGIAFDEPERAGWVVKRALRSGVIVLQSGTTGNVVTVGPPLTIEFDDLRGALDEIEICLKE